MSIVLKHSQLSSAIEDMLQGLTYWMGYKVSSGDRDLLELDFVHRARSILHARLDNSKYALRYEYPYSDSGSNKDKDRREADLVVLEKIIDNNGKKSERLICVMEFKMSDNTNGGVEHDIKKLLFLPDDLDRLVILLFFKANDKLKDFYADDNTLTITALKRDIESQKMPGVTIRVRRIAKAFSTTNYRRCPYLAFCISV